MITLAKNLVMEIHNVDNQGALTGQLWYIAGKIVNWYEHFGNKFDHTC